MDLASFTFKDGQTGPLSQHGVDGGVEVIEIGRFHNGPKQIGQIFGFVINVDGAHVQSIVIVECHGPHVAVLGVAIDAVELRDFGNVETVDELCGIAALNLLVTEGNGKDFGTRVIVSFVCGESVVTSPTKHNRRQPFLKIIPWIVVISWSERAAYKVGGMTTRKRQEDGGG